MRGHAAISHSPWSKRLPLHCALLFALFAANVPRSEGAELWDFIQVGKNYKSGLRWETRNGKAQVEIRGDHLEIRAYYTNTEGVATDGLGDVSIACSGTLDPDHAIRAKCTFLNTDAKPLELTGRYITRSDQQIWGEKRKIVTYYEIIFPHPPNRDFFGFLAEDARDE